MPPEYHFKTDWHFDAPVAPVFAAVTDIERYPAWWKDFRRVEITAGDGRAIGSRIRCEVRGSLPYSLVYTLEVLETETDRHILLRSDGDLVGHGRWAFSEVPGGVDVTYFWDVATNKPVLNVLAPVLRFAFASNHNQVMDRGFRGLRAAVEAKAA